MDLNKFKEIFISEVEDHLQKLNDNLLLAEKLYTERGSNKDFDQKKYREVFDELMRSSHTVKSSAATMGYVKMGFLMHVLEDVFDYVRNDKFQINDKLFDEIFSALDALSLSLSDIKSKNTERDVDNHSKKIKKMVGVPTKGVGKSVRPQAETETTQEKKSDVPSEKEIEENPSQEVVTESISFIKVPTKRLDELLDLTEELLVEKMRLNSLVQKSEGNVSNIHIKNPTNNLNSSLEHMNYLISSLQYLVMQSRLVPVGQIFARFPRMIRDLANMKKKDVKLTIKGEDLELDRSIIDKLGEPLVHLLRNAVDHGIEKKGTVLLEAKHNNDFASIIVEDSGRGIDWVLLVKAALSRDIITKEKEQEYLSLIEENDQTKWQPIIEKELFYNPRLSTSETVSETSGRGVGTSVVKKFIEDIGGSITVISPKDKNEGTRFVMDLPLTLAIIKALLVEINGTIFAIPFSSIERSVFVDLKDVKSVADQEVVVVDEMDVPLVSLGKLFGLINSFGEAKDNIENASVKEKKIVILVKKGIDTAGIVVDRLINEQEIIIKPLPEVLSQVKGFSGSTILGDGEAVLILDVVSFL